MTHKDIVLVLLFTVLSLPLSLPLSIFIQKILVKFNKIKEFRSLKLSTYNKDLCLLNEAYIVEQRHLMFIWVEVYRTQYKSEIQKYLDSIITKTKRRVIND